MRQPWLSAVLLALVAMGDLRPRYRYLHKLRPLGPAEMAKMTRFDLIPALLLEVVLKA